MSGARTLSYQIALKEHALNAICPYFTMFPLNFPLDILRSTAKAGSKVFDPFCGRGTTSFAARVLGLESVAFDCSPVAQAIAAAKLVSPSPASIEGELRLIMHMGRDDTEIPKGDFWSAAFHPEVLMAICRLRSELMFDCSSAERIALRALILGALHGPEQRIASYLSNQCPRTYAPKPAYAVKFWSERNMTAKLVDIKQIISKRAKRYYSKTYSAGGLVKIADSRDASNFRGDMFDQKLDWIITSPPYYGMKTYIPDQWLRYWFLGGPDQVTYTASKQILHSSPEDFAGDLRSVWGNIRTVSHASTNLILRFGGIRDRKVDPLDLILKSFEGGRWKVVKALNAGDAKVGKRQADAFLMNKTKPLIEYDIWAMPA